MKTQITCDVIGDLYPVYSEGICSEDTRQLVTAHLAECEHCRRLYADYPAQTGIPEPQSPDADAAFRRINRKLKNNILIRRIAVALLCVLIPVIFFISSNMDYGFRRYHIIPFVLIAAVVLFLVSFVRAVVQSIALIVMRVNGSWKQADKKAEIGGLITYWVAAAALFVGTILALILYVWP